MVASSRIVKVENKKLIPESKITKVLVKPLFKLRHRASIKSGCWFLVGVGKGQGTDV